MNNTLKKARFTANVLSSKLDEMNSQLGLQSGDLGSLEVSVQGGQGTAVEMITCSNRSVTRLAGRSTPRECWEEMNRGEVIERMRLKRKAYKAYSNHVKALVKEHVMSCAGVDTIEEAKEVFMQDYQAWTCETYERNYPNYQERFVEFLQASSLVEVYYYDMEKFLDTLSLTLPKKQPSNEQISRLYRNLIFKALNN